MKQKTKKSQLERIKDSAKENRADTSYDALDKVMDKLYPTKKPEADKKNIE